MDAKRVAMDAQVAINLFGKLLPILLDVASLVPGLNIPVGAIKLVEDGIQFEQAAYALLASPEAAPLRDAIHNLAHELNLHPTMDAGSITLDHGRVAPPRGYKWDMLMGWVPA